MKYKITREQLERIIPKLEKALFDYFSDDDRICGFKIYDAYDEDGVKYDRDLIDVYVIFNHDWATTDEWATLRSGVIRDKVREHLKNIFPFNFGVYSYAKKC